MFDNLIESAEEFRPNIGNGCILAHAMGLGKTIQTITFIDLFLRYMWFEVAEQSDLTL